MAGDATRQKAVLDAIGVDACLTTAEIAAAIGMQHNDVATTTCAMIRSDYVERIERGCFRLTERGREILASGRMPKAGPRGPKPGRARPQPDTLRQRAWRVMRMASSFTIGDLVVAAARVEDKDPAGNLRRWVRALADAGYLFEFPRRRRADQAPTSNGEKVYRLDRATGEHAPRLVQGHIHGRPDRIWDPNTREHIECRKAVQA
jgi:hypothetical protein